MTLDELAADAARLVAAADDAARLGLRVGELLGVGGYALVFAAEAPDVGVCALKLPHVAPSAVDEHPDLVPPGHGPNRVTLLSATGPFVLSGPRTLDDAVALLTAAWERQGSRGAPLPRVHRLLELGGLPAALMERIEGPDLAELAAARPEDARRAVPALAKAVLDLHADFGPHGDLKPAHALVERDGAVRLLDPLVATDAVGSIGYVLPVSGILPTIPGEAARLRDLVALAAILAELHGARLPLDGRVAYRLLNRGNGRFGRGVETSELLHAFDAATARLPDAERAWIHDVLEMALRVVERPLGDRPEPGWCDAMLQALAIPREVTCAFVILETPPPPDPLPRGWPDLHVGQRIRLVLTAGRPLTIGRRPDIADVALPAVTMGSHRPYRIMLEGADVVLADNGSVRPPVVNGATAAVHTLAHGDEIAMGGFVLRFERV